GPPSEPRTLLRHVTLRRPPRHFLSQPPGIDRLVLEQGAHALLHAGLDSVEDPGEPRLRLANPRLEGGQMAPEVGGEGRAFRLPHPDQVPQGFLDNMAWPA